MECHVASWRSDLKIDGGLLIFHSPTTKTNRLSKSPQNPSTHGQRQWHQEDVWAERKVLYVNIPLYITPFKSDIFNSSTKIKWKRGETTTRNLPFRPNCVQGRCCVSRAGRQRRRSRRSALDDKWTEHGNNGATKRCHWSAVPHEAKASARKDARSPLSNLTSTSHTRKR